MLLNHILADVCFPRRPILGILHEIAGNQPRIGFGIGEDSHYSGSAADLFIDPLQSVSRGDFP